MLHLFFSHHNAIVPVFPNQELKLICPTLETRNSLLTTVSILQYRNNDFFRSGRGFHSESEEQDINKDTMLGTQDILELYDIIRGE